jgi:F0F1-type ATP synthase membrane subunit b/b'
MIADLQRQLGIDYTFFIQFFIFAVFYLFFRFVFFAPYRDLLARRERGAEGTAEEAAKLEEQAALWEKEHEDSLRRGRKESAADRDAFLGQAKAEAAKVVDASRAKAKALVESQRVSSQAEADAGLKELNKSVNEVASLLVTKVTGGKVGV